MDSTVSLLAQIIPILILGLLAELRAVITKGRAGIMTFVTGAVILVLSFLLLSMEASFVTAAADPTASSWKMTGEAAGTTIWLVFGSFMVSTLLASVVLVDARRAAPDARVK